MCSQGTSKFFHKTCRQHRPESAQSCKGRGCTSSRPQKAAGAASRKALSYLGRSDSRARYTTSQVCLPVCILAALEGEKLVTFSWFSRQEHSSPVEFLPRGLLKSSNLYPKIMKIGDLSMVFTTGAFFTGRVFAERVAKFKCFFGQRTDAMIQN